MKLKVFASSTALCVSMILALPSAGFTQVQQLQPQDPEWLTRMYDQGWHKVQEGVLQRSEGATPVETFTYGEEGLRWTVQRLEEQASFLESRYNEHPDADLAQVIDRLRGEVTAANARLDSGQVGEAFAGEEMDNCDISYGAHADAGYLTSSQGVTARADAYFHNNCGYLGNSYAYVTVQAASGSVFSTKTQEDPKYNGTWVDSLAQWSLNGSTSCYSYAYGRGWSDTLNIGYSTEDTNYACPVPVTPPQVTVSGPTNVYLDDYTSCSTVTWTASVTGGVTPYSAISWYLGTTYVGSGSSYSRTYCTTNATVTAKATVTDNIGQTAQGTKTTYISYTPSCSPYDCNCIYSDFGNPENAPAAPIAPREPCY